MKIGAGKRAETSVPVLDVIAERWSVRAFRDREVGPLELAQLLEAARWAPSAFNEQPWRFLPALRQVNPVLHKQLGDLLSEGNQAWARQAPLLMMVLAAERTVAGRDNPWALHDVGLATANLLVQATAMGLGAHVMAGFDAGRARSLEGLPAGLFPVTVLAVGWPGPPDHLPPGLAEREQRPRGRRELAELVLDLA